jgi:hypothetical protein
VTKEDWWVYRGCYFAFYRKVFACKVAKQLTLILCGGRCNIWALTGSTLGSLILLGILLFKPPLLLSGHLNFHFYSLIINNNNVVHILFLKPNINLDSKIHSLSLENRICNLSFSYVFFPNKLTTNQPLTATLESSILFDKTIFKGTIFVTHKSVLNNLIIFCWLLLYFRFIVEC